MIRLSIVFVIFIHFARGQKVEQIALNHLLANLSTQKIQFQDRLTGFYTDSNKVWYSQKIISGTGKVFIPRAQKSSIESFYKVVHQDYDIHITTMKAIKDSNGTIVPFIITTNYNNKTQLDVILDKTNFPVGFVRYENKEENAK